MILRLLRALLFEVLVVLLTLVVGIGCLPLAVWSERGTCAIMQTWGRLVLLLLRVVVGIRVNGPEWIAMPEGPVILAPKHQSSMDVVIMVSQPFHTVFVLKEELRRMPIIGWYAWRAGHIFVSRDAGAPALRVMLREAEAAVAKGRPLVIFPEGTRTLPGDAPDLKPGIVAVAGQLGASVIPVALNTAVCWGRKEFLKRPGVVTVVAHPPLPPTMGRRAMLAALHTGINSLNQTEQQT